VITEETSSANSSQLLYAKLDEYPVRATVCNTGFYMDVSYPNRHLVFDVTPAEDIEKTEVTCLRMFCLYEFSSIVQNLFFICLFIYIIFGSF